MKKYIYLSTCDTCKRIKKELQIDDSWELQDIKKQHVSVEQLEEIRKYANSYEELVNKRAQKFKAGGYSDKSMSEDDWKALILSDYTFIKRPIAIIDDEYFIGNSKQTVLAAKEMLNIA